MQRLARGLLKWTFLTALAFAVGGALGSAYALTIKEPVYEAAAPLEPATVQEEAELPPEEQVGTADRTAPPAPELVTPEDGAVVSLRPHLKWADVEDRSVVVYGLEYSTDPGFPAETTTTIRNLEAPQWRPDAPFTPLVKVYWRVYALDAGLNEGPLSEARVFTPLFPLGDVEVDVAPDLTPP